jgi:serine/threonine protein kinase
MKPDFETSTQALYQSQRELGRGEDTRVELVYDQNRQLYLARKTWDRASAELRFRLRQQHRRSLNVTHPNIVQVYDLSADSEHTALTMEFIDGTEASVYLARLPSRVPGSVYVLQQLAAALDTLHKADIIHRAVKPRNWLVEDTGRAVLLDAGLAWPPERSTTDSASSLPYLAPECLRGALHSVQSDWYSFGALAYELLTGEQPFKGSLESVLAAKDEPIESLRDACSDIPDDLDDLVLALLSRDPRARPAHDEIATVLETIAAEIPFEPHIYADSPRTKPSHVQLKATAAAETVTSLTTENVAESVAMIAQSTTEASKEQAVTVSAAVPAPVRHLSAALLEEPPTLLVGEVADELAELVDDVIRTLRPTEAASPFDSALAQVLTQLTAEGEPELLCVRGARGAGKSSLLAAVEEQLIDRPGYVASTRGCASPALAALHALTQQLALAMGDHLPNTLQLIEATKRSALVRLCPALVHGADTHIDISAANVQQRLIDAHLGLRAFLLQVCAHKPVVLLIDDAHTLDADTLAALRALLNAPLIPQLHVLVTLDSASAPADAFVALLDGMTDTLAAPRVVELDPLEARSSLTPEAPPALKVAERAETLIARARAASQALAVQHAAELYEEALRAADPVEPALLQQAATAHSDAGRLRDAGRLWLSLARSENDAASAQHFELEAGACFLRAGDDEQGLAIMRGVLRNVGLHWPRTPLLTSTVERARSLLRQSRPPSAAKPSEPPAGQGSRFEALWGISKELLLIAPDVSDALSARALREAQAGGSRSQLLWAIGYEACSVANIGGVFMQRRAAALAAQARELADASANAYDLAFASSVEAIVAWFQGDWPEAEQRLRVALQAYTWVDAGAAQERQVLHNFLTAALEAQGKLSALYDQLAEARLSALQTGQRQALAFCELSSVGAPALAQDRPLQAIERADALLSAYGASTGFTPLHFQHFVVTTNARLYAGHHAQAYQQTEQAWQHIKRTHMAQLDGVAMMMQQLRARAAVALAAHSVDHEAERLRAQAHKLATSLGRSNLSHALALHHVIEANLAALNHHRSSAEAHCLRASELFDVADMPLYREVARMARGAAGEGIEARLDASQSSSLLAQAGVVDPARFAAAWFPALRKALLEVADQRA